MDSAAVSAAPVSMSASAARRLVKILSHEEPGAALRVSVKGGGCSGFQYSFDIDKSRSRSNIWRARSSISSTT
jgi:Fe-S cluster assembly iron-binding protein IscA